MKPIISPWLIYFASRADAVGTLFLIVAVAAFAICLIGFDDLTKNGFKLFISIGIISVILTVLTPTTETVYTMMVANELTSDNVRNRQIIMRSDIKLPQPFASWSNSL